MEGWNSFWQTCTESSFITSQSIRHNLQSNEECEYFTDRLLCVASQEDPFYKSVVYASWPWKSDHYFGNWQWKQVSLAVFVLLSVCKQSWNLASWSEMTPDIKLSPKEVSNIKIQQRGGSMKPAEHAHWAKTGTGEQELCNDLVPQRLFGWGEIRA